MENAQSMDWTMLLKKTLTSKSMKDYGMKFRETSIFHLVGCLDAPPPPTLKKIFRKTWSVLPIDNGLGGFCSAIRKLRVPPNVRMMDSAQSHLITLVNQKRLNQMTISWKLTTPRMESRTDASQSFWV
jgi:hypothetical protein